MNSEHESMEVDVLFVGAGPACLAGAIRLMQLAEEKAYRIPFVPSYLENQGYHIISLSRYCRWLAEIAEGLGISILPGFAGKEVLYGADKASIVGVRTGDKGIGKDGRPKSNYEPGAEKSLSRVREPYPSAAFLWVHRPP